MGVNGIQPLLNGRPPKTPPATFTGVVVKTGEGGVWVAPLGADPRHPIGPCLGARYYRPVTELNGGTLHDHDLKVIPLPLQTLCLVTTTDRGPWVLSYDLPME